MKHPQILLLPVMMFTDYFLTVWGAILKERKHSDHFKHEHYELNPIFQKHVAQKKWFNPRHALITIAVSSGLALVLQFGDFPDDVAEGLFGYFFTLFGAIIGRHLANILVFKKMARSPSEISGQIKMSHAMALSVSTYQYLVAGVPILIIALFARVPFTTGAVCGIGMLFLIHVVWSWKHRKKLKHAAVEEAVAK